MFYSQMPAVKSHQFLFYVLLAVLPSGLKSCFNSKATRQYGNKSFDFVPLESSEGLTVYLFHLSTLKSFVCSDMTSMCAGVD